MGISSLILSNMQRFILDFVIYGIQIISHLYWIFWFFIVCAVETKRGVWAWKKVEGGLGGVKNWWVCQIWMRREAPTQLILLLLYAKI